MIESIAQCEKIANFIHNDFQVDIYYFHLVSTGAEETGGGSTQVLEAAGQLSQQSEELRMVRDALGDFPLAGFFANGEICNERLYGYTGVLALFL